MGAETPMASIISVRVLHRTNDFADLSTIKRDEHGHIALADLDFLGKLLREEVVQRLAPYGIAPTIRLKDIGFELRCSRPMRPLGAACSAAAGGVAGEGTGGSPELSVTNRRCVEDMKSPGDANLRHGQELSDHGKLFTLAMYAFSLLLFGFLVDTPGEILRGMHRILTAPDTLITDYMGVGGIGAALVNSGSLALILIFIFYKLKLKINGVSVACLFTVAGFAFFGKNLFNIWFIVIGVFLYAKRQ